jgi:hypothetical protein
MPLSFKDFFEKKIIHTKTNKVFRITNILLNFRILNTVLPEELYGKCEQFIIDDIERHANKLFSISCIFDNVVHGFVFNENNKIMALQKTVLPNGIASFPLYIRNAIALVIDYNNNRSFAKKFRENYHILTYDMQNIRSVPNIARYSSLGLILNGKTETLDIFKNIHTRKYNDFELPEIKLLNDNQVKKMMAHKHREDNHDKLIRLIENKHDIELYNPQSIPLSHYSIETREKIERLIDYPQQETEEIKEEIFYTYRKKDKLLNINGDIYHFNKMDYSKNNYFLYCDASCSDDIQTGAFVVCDELGNIYQSGDFLIENSLFKSSNFAEFFTMDFSINMFPNISTIVSDSAMALSFMRKKHPEKNCLWVKGHGHNAINIYVDNLAKLKREEILDDVHEMKDIQNIKP